METILTSSHESFLNQLSDVFLFQQKITTSNISWATDKHDEGNKEKIAVRRLVQLFPNILGYLGVGTSEFP